MTNLQNKFSTTIYDIGFHILKQTDIQFINARLHLVRIPVINPITHTNPKLT